MKIRTTWKIDFDVITDIGDVEPTKEVIEEVSQINEEVKARIEDAIGINDLEKVGQIENKNLRFLCRYEM